MKKGLIAAILLLALPMLGRQRQESKPYTVAVNVDVVLLSVHVSDRDGKPVRSLLAGNFNVLDNKSPQDIALFDGEDSPATVGLIVDSSNSMRPKWSNVREAVFDFARDSNPQDEMYMIPFNDYVSPPLPAGRNFTSDPADIERVMANLTPSGTTALYDALDGALKHSKLGKFEKKVFVVISDGEDNSSNQDLDPLLVTLQQSNVTLYTVGIYDRDATDKNPKVLKQLATVTGGEAFFPRDRKETQDALQQIANRIRNQYTLGFYPSASPDGRYHKLSVTAKTVGRSRLSVYTRPGYYARVKEPK